MSTAAPASQPKPLTGGAGYEVARPLGKCQVCGRAIEPGEKFMAALRETPIGFERVDVSSECWEQFDRSNLLAFWQAVMPRPEAKKKLFVDDTVLCDLFERLSDASEPAKVNFRFVLGLILMRKRLIVYEGTRVDNDRELWNVRLKGREEVIDLFNPKLDESQVQEVSQQLSQILSEEL
jgi:hypothetical protein